MGDHSPNIKRQQAVSRGVVTTSMFKLIYAIGFAAIFAFRIVIRWRTRKNKIAMSRRTNLEMVLLAIAFTGGVLIPFLFLSTSRLAFADYVLPSWAGWIGVGVFVFALWLLWRSHLDLAQNWSDSLEIREGHRLVKSGVYKRIRHPMYASFLLWGFAQPLLLHNWFAGFSHLAAFSLLYALRVRREEQMMLDRFGGEYRQYMDRAGRIVPRLPAQVPIRRDGE